MFYGFDVEFTSLSSESLKFEGVTTSYNLNVNHYTGWTFPLERVKNAVWGQQRHAIAAVCKYCSTLVENNTDSFED